MVKTFVHNTACTLNHTISTIIAYMHVECVETWDHWISLTVCNTVILIEQSVCTFTFFGGSIPQAVHTS